MNPERYTNSIIHIVLACFLSFSGNSFAATTENWAKLALRLSGESDGARVSILRQLKKVPNLELALREALRGEKRFLALDTISALGLKSLLPELLQLAEHDETGFFYNAANSLLSKEDEPRISILYRERLFAKNCSPAAKVVILDTLGRLQILIDPIQTKLLLADPSPDVRAATLSYVRVVLLKHASEGYLSLLASALLAEPAQLRIQAIYLASELPSALQRHLTATLALCAHDHDPEVRQAWRNRAATIAVAP